MATTSSVGDVPVEFQLPRQGGARRGGHDDGGDDLVVLPPGDATPHAAREASQLRRSFFKSDLGATTAMSRCEHSLKLSKKEVIAIGPPRAPARENPAGIDAGERVGTTVRRRIAGPRRPQADIGHDLDRRSGSKDISLMLETKGGPQLPEATRGVMLSPLAD